MSSSPRIAPGTRADVGTVNFAIARLLGLATGGPPPHLFTTLGRHRGLFRTWLRFAGALMPGGVLPRVDSELLILRVAHRCDCDYEWRHHERLGAEAGLSADEIARVRRGPDAEGWTARQVTLLRAADELHDGRDLSQATWDALAAILSERELIELPLLVGHYEMLAMTLNALRVEPDPPAPSPPPRVIRLLQRALTRE